MITDFREMEKICMKIRAEDDVIVMVSGGFDPIHPGHVSYMEQAWRLGTVVAVVNGDWFLTKKKGKPFMCLEDRVKIVDAIHWVGYTIPFEIRNDMTVNRALELLKPDIFAKGGDRLDKETIPEWETCARLGIEIATNVGEEKQWSSSEYLKLWNKFSN
jgi:D-beta-D-heptose 7-phosphate kinase/D-beta-D-heptose 1-phosphate adenosyltransferase